MLNLLQGLASKYIYNYVNDFNKKHDYENEFRNTSIRGGQL